MKRKLSDGQQCHQHQQNEPPPQTETTIINTTTLTIITVYNVDSDIISVFVGKNTYCV
jgi:hypothetical protein